METVIGKAIDLVCEYTVVPIVRQLKYVFFYKSCVAEMKDAIHKLENEKEIVDREKTAAMNNGQLIHHKADDWLDEATRAKDEASSLMSYEEEKAKMSGCVIGAQILNPIARHKLGRNATKKKLAIEDIRKDRPQHDDISYAPPPPGIVDPAEPTAASASSKQQTVYNGVFRSSHWEEILEKIMKALKDDRFNVTGLHGMGGVGKSTMINEVYDQVKKQCMFDEVLRVEVKVKPEVGRIQGEIAFQLGLKFENDLTTIRANLLKDRLLKTKKKKSVLIILDDLWEKLDLQEVGIPLDGNDQVQIKLLLTSREEYLLSDKMGARKLFHLNVLSDTDALRMFKFVVGVGAEGVKDDIVTEIARKCSGLPIVIEATAKALKDMALDEWVKIMKRLDNDNVLEKLKVSYDYLSSKESKDLFLICGISRGPIIQVRDLLKYTFGLRLYNRKDSSTLVAATAKLEKLLLGLEASSMLLKSDDNRYVKIHDHMRELSVKIVEEDHPEWAHDVTLSDNYCELPDAPELKLLFSCCEGDAVELHDSFLTDMKQLTVVEFTSLNLNVALSLPSSTTQLDHMRNLRTLCLHNCCLDDISMIGELKGLQILSFRGSDIRKLPIQLRELIVLKMLDLSDCYKLAQIEPNLLGSLTKLEELNMENSFNDWAIDCQDGAPPSNAMLIELKNMSRLNNLRIHIPRTSMLPKEGQLFSSTLSMYQIVFGYRESGDEYVNFSRVLILRLDDSSDIIKQDWCQTSLQTAEVLYLSRYLDEKCKSISEMCIKGFDCLKHVQISDCSKLTHLFDFSILKSRLSSQLEEITVERCVEIQCIVVGEGDNSYDVVRLSNLQKLEFIHLPKFSSFYNGSSSNVLFTGKMVAFPCLESLKIHGLNELEELWHPTDAPAELGKLRLLQVEGCDKLVCAINSNVLMRLQRELESLSIWRCGSMKEVFHVDDAVISSSCTTDEQHLVLFSRLKKLQLKYMEGLEGIYNNKNLKGGRSTITIFLNIESLEVLECCRLRYVLCCSLPITAGVGRGGYGNLKEISIRHCDEVEAIIIVVVISGMMDQEMQPADHATVTATATGRDVVSYSYSSLKEMMIYDCSQLRTFCQYFFSEQVSDVANKDLSFFSQKEIFPCLESLVLDGLSELREIWPHEVPSDESSFKMLKLVDIGGCWKVLAVFPSTLITRLENLTHVKVGFCGQIREIIIHVGTETTTMEMMFTFPRLTTLVLSDLRKFDKFYSSSVCGFQFPCLEALDIKHCPGVETVFSGQRQRPTGLVDGGEIGTLFGCSDRLAVPNLKSIQLDCLTQIWEDEKPQGLILNLQSLKQKWHEFCGPELQSWLPVGVATYLTELTVDHCNELEYLLTPLGATSLVHLTHLDISYCFNIKKVVADVEQEEEAAAAAAANNEENQGEGIIIRRDGDHQIREITFGHLKVLKLYSLPYLWQFTYVDNMALHFPSLEDLDIWDCPHLTVFSSGIATASEPKFGDLNSFILKRHDVDDDYEWY